MKLNEFCERLYEEKENENGSGPLPSVGISNGMREFIRDQLAKANEEVLRLKEDERQREAGRFIPYRQIQCDEECRVLFSQGSSISGSTIERKDARGILPTDADQQYLFFYGWSFLAFGSFVLFVIYSSYPTSQDSLTLSIVLLVFFITVYLLSKDLTIGL
jgi:hypothetical protein